MVQAQEPLGLSEYRREAGHNRRQRQRQGRRERRKRERGGIMGSPVLFRPCVATVVVRSGQGCVIVEKRKGLGMRWTRKGMVVFALAGLRSERKFEE